MAHTMNLNRYKASFATPTSGNEFFNSMTWINYGFWGVLLFGFFAHGIMYYHPDTGFSHYDDFNIVVINVIGLAVLFVLKLFAQNIYVVGKLMSILCLLTSLVALFYTCYLTYIDHFPIAFLSAVLYFGVAAYLLNKDYIALKESAI